MRRVGFAVVVAVALTACGGVNERSAGELSPGGASAEASAAPPVAPSTTISAPRRYSFDGSVPPPPLENRGDDYPAIIQSLASYLSWTHAHNPDLRHVSTLAAPGSRTEGAIRHDLGELIAHNNRLYETESGPPQIEVISQTQNAVSIRYIERLNSQTLVNEDGRILDKRVLPKPTTEYRVLLARVADGRWLFASIEEQ